MANVDVELSVRLPSTFVRPGLLPGEYMPETDSDCLNSRPPDTTVPEDVVTFALIVPDPFNVALPPSVTLLGDSIEPLTVSVPAEMEVPSEYLFVPVSVSLPVPVFEKLR